MTNLKWVGITILVLTIFGFINSKLQPETETETVQAPAPNAPMRYTLQANEAHVLDFLLKKELSNFLYAEQSMLKTIHGLISVSASDIAKEYKSDAAAADQKYLNKKVLLSGKVESINKGADNKSYLSLQASGETPLPQAYFENTDKISAAQKGDAMILVCESAGASSGAPVFNNCQIGEEFAQLKTAELKTEVDSFLDGGQKSSDNAAILAIMAISLARTLPEKSTCFSDRSQCDKDLESAMKDYELKGTVAKVSNELKSEGLKVPE